MEEIKIIFGEINNLISCWEVVACVIVSTVNTAHIVQTAK